MLSAFGVEHPVSKRDMGPRTFRVLQAALVGGANVRRAPTYVDGVRRGYRAGRYVKTGLAQGGEMTADQLRHQHMQTAARHYGHKMAGVRGADRGFAMGLKDRPALPSGRTVARAATVGTAAAAAAGGVAAGRKTLRHGKVAKSAFGVEHPVSKAVRLDRALEAVTKPAKVKLAPVKTPLADARFSAVKKGAAAVVDDALVTPARLRVAGPKPQRQTPPAEAKPVKPLGQRLNNAIAATGGPSS